MQGDKQHELLNWEKATSLIQEPEPLINPSMGCVAGLHQWAS